MKHAVPFVCLALMFSSQLVTRAQDVEVDADTTTVMEEQQPLTVEEQLERIQEELDILKESINEPEGSIQTTVNDVKKIKKISLSGYIQARYENDEASEIGSTKHSRQFDVRRARLKVSATPTDRTTAVLQIDFGGSSVTTKDAYIAYTLSDNPTVSPTVTLGQFLTPFGFALVQSSAVRETPENPKIFKALFDKNEYDRGLKFSGPIDQRFFWEAAVMNGQGANARELNHQKDYVGRVRYAVTDALDAGVSYFTGTTFVPAAGSTPAAEYDHTAFGVDAQYYLPNMTLKAEYLNGEDLGSGKWGWYGQVARNITAKDTAVFMYEVFQDKAASVQAPTGAGTQTAYHLGWIRALDDATRLKLFYEINTEENTEKDNNVFRAELITIF